MRSGQVVSGWSGQQAAAVRGQQVSGSGVKGGTNSRLVGGKCGEVWHGYSGASNAENYKVLEIRC